MLRVAVFALLGAASPALAASPAPSAPHIDAPFLRLVGSWSCDGEFPFNHAKIASTVTFSSDAAAQVLIKQHDDRPPNAYHAVETWTFDTSKNAYLDAVEDPFGGLRVFRSDGWTSDTLVWNRVEGTAHEEFTYVLSGDKLRIDYAVGSVGGALHVGDTLTCTKVP